VFPPLLEWVSLTRVLSFGGSDVSGAASEGVSMMAHQVAWLTLVAGAKLWFVAPPDATPSECSCGDRIDYARAKRERVKHCVQMPGETIVVPDYYFHATCNLAPYTMGVGGQSESKVTRKWTVSTADPHGGEGEWPDAPRREHRFQREYIEPTYVRNSRVLLPSFAGAGGHREL